MAGASSLILGLSAKTSARVLGGVLSAPWARLPASGRLRTAGLPGCLRIGRLARVHLGLELTFPLELRLGIKIFPAENDKYRQAGRENDVLGFFVHSLGVLPFVLFRPLAPAFLETGSGRP